MLQYYCLCENVLFTTAEILVFAIPPHSYFARRFRLLTFLAAVKADTTNCCMYSSVVEAALVDSHSDLDADLEFVGVSSDQ